MGLRVTVPPPILTLLAPQPLLSQMLHNLKSQTLELLCSRLPPRTVMKSGPEIVKAGLRSFFESASEDIEKMVENLRLGKVSQARTQVKGVGQNLTYTTVALLPVLTTLFQHIAQHQFGDDVIRKDGPEGGRGAGGTDVSSATTTHPNGIRTRFSVCVLRGFISISKVCSQFSAVVGGG